MPEDNEAYVTRSSNVPECLQRLDDSLTKQYSEWWNSLSKEEILDFIAHNPTFTAEMLREIFAQTQVNINALLTFDSRSLQTHADFRGDGE